MSYQIAGGIIDSLKSKKGSIRSLCFAPKVKDKKTVYALVCETLRCMFNNYDQTNKIHRDH